MLHLIAAFPWSTVISEIIASWRNEIKRCQERCQNPLIHPRLADISQLKSLALSEQEMLWQVSHSKSEDMDTMRGFTLMSWPCQGAQLASAIYRFPFGKLMVKV